MTYLTNGSVCLYIHHLRISWLGHNLCSTPGSMPLCSFLSWNLQWMTVRIAEHQDYVAYGPVGCRPYSEIIQALSWYPWAAYLRASITSSCLWPLGWYPNRNRKERHWERRWTISEPQTMWIEPAVMSDYHFRVSVQVTYILLETVAF